MEKYEKGDIWVTKDRPRGKVRIVGEHRVAVSSDGGSAVNGTRVKVEILKGVRKGTIIDIRKDWLLRKLKQK